MTLKDFRSNVLPILVTLSFTQSKAQRPVPLLICNEGFNISYYGIPLYHWAEHKCDVESKCFMQEITLDSGYSKLKDLKLRFGGCISKELAPYISCKNMYGEDATITLGVIFKLLHGLDSKTKKVSYDFIIDSEKHLRQLFSRGGDLNEFIEGMMDFLDAIGYSRSKFENPLNDFGRCIREDDIARLESTWDAVLESLKVENDATVKLSLALTKFAKTVYDVLSEAAKNIDNVLTLAPKLAYPVLESIFGKDPVYDAYLILARAFENLDPNKPQIEIQEGYKEHFLVTVFMIQVLISDMEPRMGEKAYSASKNIITAFEEVYPHSAFGKDMMNFANIIRKYATKGTSLRTCEPLDFDCISRVNQKQFHIAVARYVELANYKFRSRSQRLAPFEPLSTVSGKKKENDSRDELILPDLGEFLNKMTKSISEIDQSQHSSHERKEMQFSDFLNDIESPIKDLAQKLAHEEKYFRKKFSPYECHDIPTCDTDLCNTHEQLQRNIQQSAGKDEL